MNTTIHRAESRGHAHHGWLNSYHSFSFASYHNSERMNFGVLRVLNDDCVAAGKGFDTHPHNNMEIISIPLKGDLEHKDSMGNTTVIKQGDVQIMNVGTGIHHSEYNKNSDKEVAFLQIWVLPKEKDIQPQYGQISTKDIQKNNAFYQIVSPHSDELGVWINQDAWFSMGDFDKGNTEQYKIKKSGNGIYLFVIEGSVTVNEELISKRDAMGISDIDNINVIATEKAQVLLMDIPMDLS